MNCKESITKPMDFSVRRTDSVKENINIAQPSTVVIDLTDKVLLQAHINYRAALLTIGNDVEGFKSIYESLCWLLAAAHDQYCNNFMEGDLDETDKRWRDYRLEDCMRVCTQEAERIYKCLECNPTKAELCERSVMELEQQLGTWVPYASDEDTDDEDWKEETGPFAQESADEEEYESESDGDIVIVE